MTQRMELFIWGIRGGYLENGIYSTYSGGGGRSSSYDALPNDIKALNFINEKDSDRESIYRNTVISTLEGERCYFIHRTQKHTMISQLYTGCREFGSSNRRAFVFFSLIIPSNKSFDSSPIKVLDQIVDFYDARAQESEFFEYDVSFIRSAFLDKIELVGNNFRIVPKSQALKFNTTHDENHSIDLQELASVLKCDRPYLAFKELMLVSKSVNTDQFKFDKDRFVQCELSQLKEGYESHLRELEIIKYEAESTSSKIVSAFKEEKYHIVVEIFQSSKVQDQLSRDAKDFFARSKSILEEDRRKKEHESEQKLFVKNFVFCVDNRDLRRAKAFYKDIKDEGSIPEDKLRAFFDLEAEYARNLARKKALEQEKKQKQKKRIVIFLIVFVILSGGLVTSSLMLKWPDSFYAGTDVADEVVENDLNGEDEEREVIEGPTEEAPNEQDSLIQLINDGEAVLLSNTPSSIDKLENKYVRIKNNKWEYSDYENKEFKEVKMEASYKWLNERFEQQLNLKTDQTDETESPIPPQGEVSSDDEGSVEKYDAAKIIGLVNTYEDLGSLSESEKSTLREHWKAYKNSGRTDRKLEGYESRVDSALN